MSTESTPEVPMAAPRSASSSQTLPTTPIASFVAQAGKRRRIYVSAIGTSDPFPPHEPQPQEGPAVAICRAVRPDVVYLLPSAARPDVRTHTMRQAEETRDWLVGEGLVAADSIYVKALEVRDVTDYAEVLPELERLFGLIRGESEPAGPCAYFVNGSSGTPQIQAASMLLVATGTLPLGTVVQAAHPQHQTRSERVVAVDVSLVVERQRADEAIRLFDRGFFQSAGQLLHNLAERASTLDRRSAAKVGEDLSSAYAALDEADYGRAAGRLAAAAAAADGTVEFAPALALLKAQGTALQQHQARRDAEDALFLADLYHSADRRRAAGLYSEALGRAWRCLEGGLYLHLRQRHGIDAARLGRSADRPNAERVARACYPGRSLGEVSLRVTEWHQVLAGVLGDTAFAGYLNTEAQMPGGRRLLIRLAWEEVRQARNRSVIAHGVRPVTREESDGALTLARSLLAFLGTDATRAQYPFRRDALREVAAVLRQALCS